MTETYLVWHCPCCGVSVCHSKEEAFQRYGDLAEGHYSHAVEGPGGVDLTEEAKHYRSELEPVGRIELCDKTCGWYIAEEFFEEHPGDNSWMARMGQMMAQFTEVVGPERVRFALGSTPFTRFTLDTATSAAAR